MAELGKRGLRPPAPCLKWGCLGGQGFDEVDWGSPAAVVSGQLATSGHGRDNTEMWREMT